MINFHPSDTLLARYASADLSAGLSLAVATHLDYCPICRASVAEFEQAAADDLLELEPNVDIPAFDSILADILQSEPPEKSIKTIDKAQPDFINVNDQKFALPQTLSRFYSSDGRWRKFGGVHSSKLGTFDDFRSNLIYIEADTNVPKHTHKSLEITVVLAGDLCDEQGHYQPGDFIVLDGSVTHMPTTRPNQSCLCLAVMDAPLQFTQGAARLLNPFAQLLY